MDNLVAIVIMSLTALGVFTSMAEGMILEPVKNFLSRFITGKMAHPFYDCPRCMVSVWGTMALAACWWMGMPVVWELWPVYALCAVGLQEMFDR